MYHRQRYPKERDTFIKETERSYRNSLQKRNPSERKGDIMSYYNIMSLS